jgi:hypothetical protein
VTESDPALTDLRLLLQVNQAITLGKLDRYERALTVAGRVKDLASQVGVTARPARRGGTSPRLRHTPSSSATGLSARWPWPAAWTVNRMARCRRRWPC